MKTRFDYTREAHRPAVTAMFSLEGYIRHSGLEKTTIELVKTRCSQINGCAYCIDMHTKDARAAGETEGRLYGLSAWRETPYYSDRERAALAWAEALTLIARDGLHDEAFESVTQHFSEDEVVALTFVVTTINAWNRLAIASRVEPGTYKIGAHAA